MYKVFYTTEVHERKSNIFTTFLCILSFWIFVVCHQCGDESAGIPCTVQQIYDPTIQPRACPSGKDYCMTDVYDTNGNDMIYKRYDQFVPILIIFYGMQPQHLCDFSSNFMSVWFPTVKYKEKTVVFSPVSLQRSCRSNLS